MGIVINCPNEGPFSLQENTGTSLLEAFSYDEIKTHLNKLRDAAFISAQALANSTKTEILYPNPKNDAACSACGVIKLAFEPPAIFCSCCSQKIKRNQVGILHHLSFLSLTNRISITE